jgi:hypothetical protein
MAKTWATMPRRIGTGTSSPAPKCTLELFKIERNRPVSRVKPVAKIKNPPNPDPFLTVLSFCSVWVASLSPGGPQLSFHTEASGDPAS